MNTNELELAQQAFDAAVKHSFPADLIRALYVDLVAARKRNQRAARAADKKRNQTN